VESAVKLEKNSRSCVICETKKKVESDEKEGKRMKKLITICVVVGILVIGGTVMAATTTITQLLPSSATPVAGSWYLSDVRTGGTASIVSLTGLGGNLESGQPLPTGAVKLTTDMTNAAKAEVGTFGDFGLASTALNDMVIGYNYYRQNLSGGSTFAAPSIKLQIYAAGGTGDNFGSLVYEPYWNGSVASNIWQSVSINSSTGAGGDSTGGWWWDGGFNIANGAGGPPIRSLSEWVTAFQASDATDFANAHIVALSMGVGTYNQGQIDYFDNLSIRSTAGNVDAVYNFEVPEPATMCLLGLGALSLLKRRKR
jgi:hypothetical protein